MCSCAQRPHVRAACGLLYWRRGRRGCQCGASQQVEPGPCLARPNQVPGPSFPSMPLTPLLCPLSLSVAATTLVEVREEDDSCLRTMASFASFHPAAASRSLVRIDALAIDGWAPAFHTSDLCQLLVVTTELQALKITNTNHFNRTPA